MPMVTDKAVLQASASNTTPMPLASPYKNTPSVVTTSPAASPYSSGVQSQMQLKRIIEQACGRSAREVQVVGTDKSGIQVRITASNHAEAVRLYDLVMKLPDLAPYALHLEVRVAP
jgi:hypothetical protein